MINMPRDAAPTTARRFTEVVVNDLLDAALQEFAAHGFDGASTRAIAARAGAHQSQIGYHFASKQQLWQRAVDRLFGRLSDVLVGLDGRTADERFADGVRRFLRFSAGTPELHRIMNLESTAASERLDWLVERHVRPTYDLVAATWREVRAAGKGLPHADVDVWLLLVGYGALAFANAPVVGRLGGPDPSDAADVDAHTERLLGLLGLHPAPRTRRTRSR
jgi:AcrR family transcriptional regulator